MSELRRGIFKKYPTVGERYAHAPENVPPRIWRQMVDKWMDEGWKQQIGIELSPLDLFKMFHVRKNGIWASNKAKEMHASKARMCMVLQVNEDIVLTKEDDDGYEDDEVEANNSETE
ncbi:hypothetical protein WN944_022824 [Citrus x changshan-huyou]|uniref:Transposase n=1 Tax=Citrus x changshan-huyou TaxID=2935761 RepID=A0AAP0R1L2_9ROSI